MADADDVLKGAGKLFSKLGSSLKSAGGQIKQTTKQVTGLGRGSVKLELDQTRVAPGGTLKGRVVLAVSEPVEAKKLVVTLRASAPRTPMSTSSISSSPATRRTRPARPWRSS